MNAEQLVILRGSYKNSDGSVGRHWMLGTLYTRDGGEVSTVVALDPWTGQQVEIDPVTKKVLSPPSFPLANFRVNGYRLVTVH